MPRIFTTPTTLLRSLASGCPSLHDALAEAMTATGEDPEVQIRRDATIEAWPPQWSVVVRAGAYRRELPLDTFSEEAMSAAVTMYLCDLVHDLERELPGVFARLEIQRGVDRLVPWARSRTRGGSS